MPEDRSLFIIDGIAPFFTEWQSRQNVNWSKIPFASLETNNRLDRQRTYKITQQFKQFTGKAAETGYNAVTLDDVAHLVPFYFYPHSLKTKIEEYQFFYRNLFEIAKKNGMKVFITTDIMYLHESIIRHTRMEEDNLIRFLYFAFRSLFNCFKEVDGVLIRIGESDGLDVRDTFRSRITIQKPQTIEKYIRSLLPVFEEFQKLMIFRTWTLGTYPVGDLMWNPKTRGKCFRNIQSEHFIISQKFGAADFFGYLELNPFFKESTQNKLVELQARREYEGFGEFPAYIGYDYERYKKELEGCSNIKGILVWCQTGGWSSFRRLTFLSSGSVWNHLNTYSTLKIFRNGLSAEEAAARFCSDVLGKNDTLPFLHLVRLSAEVIRELWYLPEFSEREFYFRRLRLPPVLWVFWDTIFINHTLRKVLKRLVYERRKAVRKGHRTLELIREMKKYAQKLEMDTAVFDFQYDTFRIIALGREYFLGHWNPEIKKKLESAAEQYRQQYPDGFRIELDFSPVHINKWIIKILFRLSLRTRPGYRIIDRIFLLGFSGWLLRIIAKYQRKRIPKMARNQAMGVEALLR